MEDQFVLIKNYNLLESAKEIFGECVTDAWICDYAYITQYKNLLTEFRGKALEYCGVGDTQTRIDPGNMFVIEFLGERKVLFDSSEWIEIQLLKDNFKVLE